MENLGLTRRVAGNGYMGVLWGGVAQQAVRRLPNLANTKRNKCAFTALVADKVEYASYQVDCQVASNGNSGGQRR
jgi:hypothetical protein